MRISPRYALRAAAFVVASIAGSLSADAQSYKVNNIISDGSVPAALTDPNFLNPWAISASGTWWISTANSGYNYVVPATTGAISFKVIVPTATAPNVLPGLPAGSVTTGGAVGMVIPAPNSTKASFLFSTLDGTISGWNSKLGTANAISTVLINNSAAGASYPGLAILNVASGGVTSKSYILAPNFGTGNKVEIYDSNFAPTTLGANFVDPTLPAGYSPYAIHIIGSQVFITYALRTATAPYRTVDGAGNGVVNAFDFNGNFVARVATGGNLNSPWGVAIAPANFGIFSNDILIGNFGDGKINVYDPKTFAYLGQMMDAAGKPLVYTNMWELLPGGTTVAGTTAVSGGDVNTVYFTAALDKESHGLLAGISNGTTTGAAATYGFSAGSGAVSLTAGGSATVPLSVASTNGFSGTVTLACSGLPTGATCSFAPATLGASSTAPAVGAVTIQTTKASAALHMPGAMSSGIVAATLLPFAGLLMLRRRRSMVIRLLGVAAVMLASGMVLSGCGDYTPPVTPTPAGTSAVTVTATSGSISQSTTISLTVK